MGDKTESIRLKRMAKRQQNQIQIAAGFGVGNDIGQQR
jgi:hypothetical protein